MMTEENEQRMERLFHDHYLIYMYTQDFVLKTPIGIGIYLAVLAIISFISSSTVIWQIHKAAQIDPAKIIRSE